MICSMSLVSVVIEVTIEISFALIMEAYIGAIAVLVSSRNRSLIFYNGL